MLNVHRQGIGISGFYTYEVPETKWKPSQICQGREGSQLKCPLQGWDIPMDPD